MRNLFGVAAAVLTCGWTTGALGAEGATVAGPIGGTDIRSAQLPPPGLYGGMVFVYATAREFVDGSGHAIPALTGLKLARNLAGPFLFYVPDFQVLGGSVAIGGIVPGGSECGRLFEATQQRCVSGIGDPYVEAVWSRFFGTVRPSRYPGAYPIAEGLTIELGFGAVIPIGKYNVDDAVNRGLSIGNNIWDLAPIVAFTYTTPPILAEGTEISARLYWNNYLTNPATQYSTGAVLNTDFAVSEHIGRFQVGAAGFYIKQVADDKQFGVPIPPDGRRAEVLMIGGVLGYDMPEYGASMKLKILQTAVIANSVNSFGVSFGWIKKLQ